MSDLVIGALLALGGASVGAFVTWWNTSRVNKTAKENARLADGTARENAVRTDNTTRALKLTDHRVAWVQRLRDEMAAFHSWGMTPNLDQASQREFYEHGTRIELLMNPQDPDYEALQSLMYGLLTARETTEKYAMNSEYIDVCQRILKREWEVAKQELRDGVSNPEQIMFSRG